MKHLIEVETDDSPEGSSPGLIATVSYILSSNLKQIPGITSVKINSIETVEE